MKVQSPNCINSHSNNEIGHKIAMISLWTVSTPLVALLDDRNTCEIVLYYTRERSDSNRLLVSRASDIRLGMSATHLCICDVFDILNAFLSPNKCLQLKISIQLKLFIHFFERLKWYSEKRLRLIVTNRFLKNKKRYSRIILKMVGCKFGVL